MSGFRMVDRSAEVLAALEARIPVALEAAGLQAEAYAKLELENSPRRIDTGNLRNSISHSPMSDRVEQIGTNIEYAMYVHEGTSKMAPNRFLKNALENNADQLKQIVMQYLKG